MPNLKTTTNYKNKTLRIRLDIPLLEKDDYNLHRIHSVPVVQPVLKNGSGRAYVRSEFTHIAIENSQRTYLLMEEGGMVQCKKLKEFYMCPNNSPVYEASTYASCESSLLNNRTVESFRLCEVQVSYKKRPYFKILETLNGWMYSVLATTTVKITCPSRKPQTVQLSGVGIVRTSGLSLPSPGSRAQTSVVTYEPHLHLNLSELSPALLQHKQLMASPEPQQEPPEGSPAENGRCKENDETLSKLEDQLNEISS